MSLRSKMAQQRFQMDKEKFCCSICLDLLKDPVTIPCGHSYCMDCIESHWDAGDHKKAYRCPQCRGVFTPRPVLGKNTMLADLVEGLKKIGSQDAPSDQCYATHEDVACDFCTRIKLKAVKSCLQCLVSYCEKHLQPHFESPAFKKHKLVDPSKKLQENICPLHNEVMKIFCCTDLQCICYLCSMEDHKDHDTVSAAEERAKRHAELFVCCQNIQQRTCSRENDMKVLQLEEAINHSADKAVMETKESFTHLIHHIRKRRSDVEQQIRSKQKAEVSRVRDLREKLAIEITDLRRKSTELEQLLLTEDNIRFLQGYTALPTTDESITHSFTVDTTSPVQYFEDVTAAVSVAIDEILDILSIGWEKISHAVTVVDVLPPQLEPQSRDEFLQCSHPITLDSNTASPLLLISNGDRKATAIEETLFGLIKMGLHWQFDPLDSHNDFFRLQVLSGEGLTGRCYWEVEWSGHAVAVAVTYKSMRKTIHNRGFGYNDGSWVLVCFRNQYQFRHNNTRTYIAGPQFYKVGVFLDHKAGTLSFYRVSETMTLLHTVQTKFTEPLYAGLMVGYNSTAEFQ